VRAALTRAGARLGVGLTLGKSTVRYAMRQIGAGGNAI